MKMTNVCLAPFTTNTWTYDLDFTHKIHYPKVQIRMVKARAQVLSESILRAGGSSYRSKMKLGDVNGKTATCPVQQQSLNLVEMWPWLLMRLP